MIKLVFRVILIITFTFAIRKSQKRLAFSKTKDDNKRTYF